MNAPFPVIVTVHILHNESQQRWSQFQYLQYSEDVFRVYLIHLRIGFEVIHFGHAVALESTPS